MIRVADKTKWQLTQKDFDALLSALDANNEKAGEKYLLLRRNLTRFFEARGFSTAEDAAEDVLNRLARKLGGGEKIENADTYALGIARMAALELRRSPVEKTSNELPEIPISPSEKEQTEQEQKLKCLDKCLKKLSKEKREIIVGYYQGEKSEKIENRRKMAEKLDIPQYTLRNRAARLREKLESCIVKCVREEE